MKRWLVLVMDGRGKKILVVDDDQNIQEAIKIILEMNNFKVEVDDGSAVEEKVSATNPDLVLLDILLAGKDGRKICLKMKSSKKNESLPVILISAHADAANSYKKCRANDFLAKPFEIDDLLSKVNKHL